jgi:hypothetical protein
MCGMMTSMPDKSARRKKEKAWMKLSEKVFPRHPVERTRKAGGSVRHATRPKPVARASHTVRPDLLARYIIEVDVACEECGGSGFDPGGLDPWGPEPCPLCAGTKTQKIMRNYLTEAFRIAANPDSACPVERRHLTAVIQHCREAVSALVSLPEVA